MLTSLLPGLRELRAPLAAGYLWLTAAWLGFGSLSKSGHGLVGFISKGVDHLSAPERVAVLTFCAYLVGSISEQLFSDALRFWPHIVLVALSVRDVQRPIVVLARLLRPLTLPPFEWLMGPHNDPLLFSGTGGRALREYVDEAVRKLDGRLGGSNVLLSDIISAETGVTGFAFTDGDEFLVDQVAKSVPGLRVKLAGTSETRQVGLDLDRHRAEAEFRISIAPPVLAVGIAAAARATGFYVAILVTAAIIVSLLLYRQGVRRMSAENGDVAESLLQGTIASPFVERLARRVDAAAADSEEHNHDLRDQAVLRELIPMLRACNQCPPTAEVLESVGRVAALVWEASKTLPYFQSPFGDRIAEELFKYLSEPLEMRGRLAAVYGLTSTPLSAAVSASDTTAA